MDARGQDGAVVLMCLCCAGWRDTHAKAMERVVRMRTAQGAPSWLNSVPLPPCCPQQASGIGTMYLYDTSTLHVNTLLANADACCRLFGLLYVFFFFSLQIINDGARIFMCVCIVLYFPPSSAEEQGQL